MEAFHAKEPIREGKDRLDVFLESGRLEVVAHDEPVVRVDGENEGLKITISRRDDTVLIRAENPRKWRTIWGRSPRARLVVRVPGSCAVRAHVVAGSADVAGIQAPVRVDVVAGRVSLADLGDSVDASAVSGSVSYQGLLAEAEHRFASTTGRVDLCLYKEPDAWLDAGTVAGGVRVGIPLANERSRGNLTGRRITGKLGLGTGKIRARVVTGSISLTQKQVAPVAPIK